MSDSAAVHFCMCYCCHEQTQEVCFSALGDGCFSGATVRNIIIIIIYEKLFGSPKLTFGCE